MNLSAATLLLTRPKPAATRFAHELEAEIGRFAQVVVSPLLEIVPVDVVLDDTSATVFVFTSEQGARRAAELAVPLGRRAICVGQRTAKAATELGYLAEVGGRDVEDLLQHILREPPFGPMLHISGRHSRGDLASRLSDAGLDARRIIAYDQRAQILSEQARMALAQHSTVIAPLFSPRTAALFAAQAADFRADLRVAAISPAAAQPLEPVLGVTLEIACSPDAQGLRAAVVKLLARPPIA